MSKLLKKVFTFSVVALTIVWSLGLAALVPTVVNAAETCPTLVAGDAYKAGTAPAVWVLDSNMNKVYFPNEDVYKTWYAKADGKSDWAAKKNVAASCDVYNQTTDAVKGVNYFPGSVVFKLSTIATKYYVTEAGNKKTEISEAAAAELFGATWKSNVKTYSEYFSTWTATDGVKMETARLGEGWLVKKAGGDVYQVTNGKLVKVDGTLTGAPVRNVRTVSATLFDAAEKETTTVTPASLIANPIQRTGTTTETTTTVTGGDLTVSLAADTPAAGYAMASAARVAFTKVTFRAGSKGVTIDQFKVKRTGFPAVDADFSTINVVDPNGNLLNDSGKTLNSDHEVTFTEDVVLTAGESKTYTLVGDMAAAAALTAGNVPKLALTTVVSSNASSVTGLPVEGNAMTTNESLTLGTVTLAEGTQVGTVTKQVGATNVNLANVKVTNTGSTDTKDIRVEKIVFYNSGTAADADVSNYKLKYNGTVVSTGVMVNKYITFDLSTCGDDCKIAKGYDRTYEVYADLTAGSGRTINLDVQYATHVMIKDINNSVYLTATDSATAMTNTVTVSQGKLNVTKTNDVPAGNVSGNSTNVELGSWNFKVTGEPIDVRQTVFKITTTGTIVPTGLDSLVLYDKAGKALIGSVDGVGASSPGFATSTDTFTLQPGDNILTLKGTIDNTAVSADTIKIDVDMTGTKMTARGVNSSLDITMGTYLTPNAVVDGPTKTVRTSALSVTTLTTPASASFAPGASDVLFAKVMLDASASSEDLKVSQFIVSSTITTSKAIDIQNLRLFVDKDGDSYNGSGTPVALTEILNGTESGAGTDEVFTWNLSGDDQFIVKAGKKLVVEVKGNIVAGATAGTVQFATNGANQVTAVGQTTKNTVTETIDTSVTGQAMTIGTAGGTLEVALSSDNPSASLVAAGSTVTLAAYRFMATTTEDVELDYMYLTQVVNTDTASSSYKDYDEIWFEDVAGNEIAGTRMAPTSTFPYVDFADNAFVVKTTDGAKVLYLKAKLSTIGNCASLTCTGANGTPGFQVGYKVSAAADVVGKGDLSGSASTEYLSSTSAPTGNSHYVYKSYPVVSKETLSSTLANGTRDLYKFKVTAVNGDVALGGFTFDIATTTATVVAGTCYLYDVTDSTEKQINDTGACGTTSANKAVNAYYGTGVVTQIVGHGDDWDTTMTNDQVLVSVNKPRTLVLRANISGATTGASVSAGMAGDSAALTGVDTTMLTAANVDAQTNDDFIWSDVSDQSHADSTLDWTNGYLVSGLNSTTSTLQTLSL